MEKWAFWVGEQRGKWLMCLKDSTQLSGRVFYPLREMPEGNFGWFQATDIKFSSKV